MLRGFGLNGSEGLQTTTANFGHTIFKTQIEALSQKFIIFQYVYKRRTEVWMQKATQKAKKTCCSSNKNFAKPSAACMRMRE